MLHFIKRFWSDSSEPPPWPPLRHTVLIWAILPLGCDAALKHVSPDNQPRAPLGATDSPTDSRNVLKLATTRDPVEMAARNSTVLPVIPKSSENDQGLLTTTIRDRDHQQRLALNRAPAADKWPLDYPADLPKTHTNSIGMQLVLIPAGEFLMGSTGQGAEGGNHEMPCHRVRITTPFYLGVYEVTQGQYEQVMHGRPWGTDTLVVEGADYAASYISWNDAQEFCQTLSALEGREYRLPTEAQWEYACRAGTYTHFSFGDDLADLDLYAWHRRNARYLGAKCSRPVGQKLPNVLGLHDMHGNVREWCQDWYHKDYYRVSPSDDPTGPNSGHSRVVRGGSYDRCGWYCRSADRRSNTPVHRDHGVGIRIVMSSHGDESS